MQEEEYTIPQMVDDVRAGKMPRRQFIKTLSVMGISAAGIGAISTAAARSFTCSAATAAKTPWTAASRWEGVCGWDVRTSALRSEGSAGR